MERAVLQSDELLEFGMIDGIREWDEMKGALPRPRGEEDPVFLASKDYDGISAKSVGRKGKHKIAVVHAQGMIAGESSGMDPLFGTLMGHADVNRDLARALEDKDVVAVVFRVDSPGGRADQRPHQPHGGDRGSREAGGGLHGRRGRVRRLQHLLPGPKILADGNTITGSIGSITGKLVLRDLYHKLGVTRDGVGMGPTPISTPITGPGATRSSRGCAKTTGRPTGCGWTTSPASGSSRRPRWIRWRGVAFGRGGRPSIGS